MAYLLNFIKQVLLLCLRVTRKALQLPVLLSSSFSMLLSSSFSTLFLFANAYRLLPKTRVTSTRLISLGTLKSFAVRDVPLIVIRDARSPKYVMSCALAY